MAVAGEPPARAIRLTRSPAPTPEVSPLVPPRLTEPEDGELLVVRPNRDASQRVVRLALLYAIGLAVVYAGLVALARAGPTGDSSGTTSALVLVGVLAAVLGAGGVLYSLGAAPRSVELWSEGTVVVGRFWGRYRFPAAGRLRVTVLRRFPAGPLTPGTIESVEIFGGSSRRSFLLDERILEPAADDVGAP